MLKERLGVEADIEPGARREFSVLVDGRRVARRLPLLGLPGERTILARVRRRIG